MTHIYKYVYSILLHFKQVYGYRTTVHILMWIYFNYQYRNNGCTLLYL